MKAYTIDITETLKYRRSVKIAFPDEVDMEAFRDAVGAEMCDYDGFDTLYSMVERAGGEVLYIADDDPRSPFDAEYMIDDYNEAAP